MFTRLQDSFGAVYALLEKPNIARRAVAVLLGIHTLLLGYSAYVHSPTLNEPGHLVAGLSYWKFGRFDVYNVNPPLVKMVAALPVMAAGYEEDWSGFYEGPGARPEMSMGAAFVKTNGERSFFLFMIARWACIPFSWIGAIVCYLWARDLYGRPSGVMAAVIWCFEPNILAHASMMTPDAHATALGLAACYTFWRWLKRPTWSQAALTGVVLGLAELAKTTLILFYPLWPLMWLIYRWPDRRFLAARDWVREAGMLGLRMLIGLYVLNFGYGFEGSFTQLKEFHFVSGLFNGEKTADLANPQSAARLSSPKSIRNPQSRNRFANTWLGELPAPFPRNYLLGIDLQQHDFEDYGRPSYLRGVWQDHGWWYYYLYACAIKMPLGLWLLGLMAIAKGLIASTPLTPDTPHSIPNSASPIAASPQRTALARDQFILLFPAVVIFTVASSKTGFNEHMRYVLPAFPYCFIAFSQVARFVSPAFKNLFSEEESRCLTNAAPAEYSHLPLMCLASPATVWRRSMTLLPAIAVAFLGSWFIASSLWIYPHSLSYFNESIGGPLNGPKHLLGSNVDWGQDLLYVTNWVHEHPDAEPTHLAFHGNIDPSVVGFSKTLPWPNRLPLVKDAANYKYGDNTYFQTGCYAISVSLLRGSTMAARDGAKAQNNDSPTAYVQAKSLQPTARAGYSIWIFR